MTGSLRDLGVTAGLLVAGLGWGLWVLGALGMLTALRVRHLLVAVGLGLGLLGYLMFGMGLAGLLGRGEVLAAYTASLGVGLAGVVRYRAAVAGRLRGAAMALGGLPLGGRLLLGFLSVLSLVNLLGALAPVVGVDELIYRVAAADQYLREGRIVYLPSLYLHQQPQHVQMIQMWGMSLASGATTQVLQWAMGLVLVAALVDLGRRVMPLEWALLGAAIFASCSDVIVLSGRAAPDLANGLFLVLAVVAWLEWLDDHRVRWLVVAGVLAGLFAAGSRLQGAYGAFALALIVGLSAWRLLGRRQAASVLLGLGVGAVSFLTVLPWYLKATAQTGNPTWPFLMGIFGSRDYTPASYAYQVSIQEREIGSWWTIGRVLVASWDFTFRPSRFHSGTMGPLPLAALPLALAFRPPRTIRWILALTGVLALAWYFSYPRLRAFLPGVGLLAIAAAYLIWRLYVTDRVGRWVRTGAVVLAGLWLAVGLVTAVRDHWQAALVTLRAHDADAYLATRLAEPDMDFHWYRNYRALNQLLPAGSELLIYESRGYYLDFEYQRYELIARREKYPERLRDPAYVTQKVHEEDTDYVLLWPKLRHTTAYRPSQWLAETLYKLCGSAWPVVYRSPTMIACRVTPTGGG